MPTTQRESRQDEGDDDRMPDVIHLAPTLEVDCPVDSPEEPVIVEDLTGYEVIKGRYYLVIRSCQTEYLVEGERMDIGLAMQKQLNQKREEKPHRRSRKKERQRRRQSQRREVAQAYSFLKTSSDLSEITLDDKDNDISSKFECQRLSL